jgi:hypothetical protein
LGFDWRIAILINTKGVEANEQFYFSAFADEIADDLKTQMDVLEQHGISYMEMRGVNRKPLVLHLLEEVRKIKKELEKRGFKISAIGSPLEPHLGTFKGLLALEQDSKITDLPEGGPKTFAIAVKALKKILSEITKA